MINKNFFKVVDIINDKYDDAYMFRYFFYLYNFSNLNRKNETDDFVCWMSNEQISERCHVSITKIKQLKKQLIEDGIVMNLVDTEKKVDGKNLKTKLRVNVNFILSLSKKQSDEEQSKLEEEDRSPYDQPENSRSQYDQPIGRDTTNHRSQYDQPIGRSTTTYKDNIKENSLKKEEKIREEILKEFEDYMQQLRNVQGKEWKRYYNLKAKVESMQDLPDNLKQQYLKLTSGRDSFFNGKRKDAIGENLSSEVRNDLPQLFRWRNQYLQGNPTININDVMYRIIKIVQTPHTDKKEDLEFYIREELGNNAYNEALQIYQDEKKRREEIQKENQLNENDVVLDDTILQDDMKNEVKKRIEEITMYSDESELRDMIQRLNQIRDVEFVQKYITQLKETKHPRIDILCNTYFHPAVTMVQEEEVPYHARPIYNLNTIGQA